MIAALPVTCAGALATAGSAAAAQPPVNISLPTISGSAVEGQTLIGTSGTWDNPEATYAYQWQRSDGVGGWDDVGPNTNAHTLTSADIGHTIRLRVIASDVQRDSLPAFSAPTAEVVRARPVNISPPTISGEAVVGKTLVGTNGTWDDPAATFTYRWQRSDGVGSYESIPGAVGATYKLTSADVGHTIRLRVTASNAGGPSVPPAVSAPIGPVAAPDQPSLQLFVSRRPEVFKRATVRAEGSTDSPLKLWVFENLRRGECSPTPAGRSRGMRPVVTGVEVDGAFSEKRRPRMKAPGRHAYCAYLGPHQDTADETAVITRRVRKPLLTEARAERTVATALSRHGFAGRVVANLQESCRRRSRNEFQCRFSSAFPGYFLSGLGSVELKRRLSYRFRVSIRGRSFGITHKNEGGFPH